MLKFKYLILLLAFTSIPVKASDINKNYFTLLGFTLNKTNLFKIKTILGNTQIESSGETGDHITNICYFIREKNTTIIFGSGEFGGPKRELLNFSVVSGINDKMKCGSIKSLSSNELKVGKLYLYQSKNELKKLFDKKPIITPTVEGKEYFYSFVRKTKNAYINAGIRVLIKNGKVVKIKVSRAYST